MGFKSKVNLIGFVFLIVFIATSSALTIGQILTQAQINETDIQETSLQPEIGIKEKTDNQVRVWFSYFTLEDLENGTYEVIRKNNVAVYNLENYSKCRESGETKTTCIASGKAELISQAKTIILGEKDYLEEMQGQDYSNEITAEDFEISNEDLEEIKLK